MDFLNLFWPQKDNFCSTLMQPPYLHYWKHHG